MNVSAPFIRRPIATTLLAAAIILSGTWAYTLLPVAPLPRVDFPTIQVSAALPGASPETMASAVATPLERRLGRIAGVTEMTSSSSLGSCSITLPASSSSIKAALSLARPRGAKRATQSQCLDCDRSARAAAGWLKSDVPLM